MGVLSKLLGRSDEKTHDDINVECPHTALTARWDRSEDIGKNDLATGFRCESCGEMFSGDEGRRLLQQRQPVSL